MPACKIGSNIAIIGVELIRDWGDSFPIGGSVTSGQCLLRSECCHSDRSDIDMMLCFKLG